MHDNYKGTSIIDWQPIIKVCAEIKNKIVTENIKKK